VFAQAQLKVVLYTLSHGDIFLPTDSTSSTSDLSLLDSTLIYASLRLLYATSTALRRSDFSDLTVDVAVEAYPMASEL